jgi:hypothetical protein
MGASACLALGWPNLLRSVAQESHDAASIRENPDTHRQVVRFSVQKNVTRFVDEGAL